MLLYIFQIFILTINFGFFGLPVRVRLITLWGSNMFCTTLQDPFRYFYILDQITDRVFRFGFEFRVPDFMPRPILVHTHTTFRPWYQSFIESLLCIPSHFRVFSGQGTVWETLKILEQFEVLNCVDMSEIQQWMKDFPESGESNILIQDIEFSYLNISTGLRSIRQLHQKLCSFY